MPNNLLIKNPLIADGQDPWITRDKSGRYHYVYTSKDDDYVAMRSASQINDLMNCPERIIFRATRKENSAGMWAPELHQIKGKWYVYFAACDGVNRNHRMYVLEAKQPNGPYRELGKIADRTDLWAIDMTVLNYKKQLYGIWSGWKEDYSDTDFPQVLYIARMSNPWTIDGERVMISEPTYDWEKSVQAINEGPEIIRRGDNIWLTYSANASWAPPYCLGILKLVGEDIMNPMSWIKDPEPIFCQGETNIYGPGHASFVKINKDLFMIYHAKKEAEDGWNREVRIKRVGWNKGRLSLGVPV